MHPPPCGLSTVPDGRTSPPRKGGRTLDPDRLGLTGVDLAGLSREDVLAALTDAALEAQASLLANEFTRGPADFGALRPVRFTPWTAVDAPDAEFYSPDQPRDWHGRWTSGGGEGAAPTPTHAQRGDLRQASLQAVRAYVRAGGEPSHAEHEQLAAHLARLTVDQLHQVKAEHGLKASAKVKADLVAKLAERFRAHRAKQESAGLRALREATAGREGWHAPRETVGGHAALHGPTGVRVRADRDGTLFDVLTSGSTLHSTHATAHEAVRAAEASDRFGTGQSTAEREHADRQEAIRKAQERAAQAQKPTTTPSGVPEGGGKQPHEMTQAEYVAAHGGIPTTENLRDYSKAVKAAARAGQPLSDRVLKDNPELAAKQGKVFHAWELTRAQHNSHSMFHPAYPDAHADHRREVLKAVRAGKLVPPEVLAEYPDMSRRVRFSDADAPLRPVRFVPLVQPLEPADSAALRPARFTPLAPAHDSAGGRR